MTIVNDSYGYYYKESAPDQGQYIRLPNGHDHDNRLEAGKNIDWDICLFFYSNDGIHFHAEADKKTAIGTYKDPFKPIKVSLKDFTIIE